MIKIKKKKIFFVVIILIIGLAIYLLLTNSNKSKQNEENTNNESNINEDISNSKSNIPEENLYNIDIDKTIKEYELERYSKLIYENKQLFAKYAYTLENNKGITDHKKILYHLFVVIADNKEYLDEELFFESLSDLRFIVDTNSFFPGTYGAGPEGDHIVTTWAFPEENIIFHELMHFIDVNLNNNHEKPQVLIEPGAEIYSGLYFFNSNHTAYRDIIGIYYILEYIIGKDKMKEAFFNDQDLYNYLSDYLTEDEYNDFLLDIGDFEGIGGFSVDYHSDALDKLIDIYIKKNGNNWDNDYIFCALLYSANKDNISYFKNSKYYKQYLKVYNRYNELYNKITNEIMKLNNTNSYIQPNIVYENDTIYFVTWLNAVENDSNTFIVKYQYDFSSNKLKFINKTKYGI